MRIFLDNEECMDDDNLSFSDDSYEAEVESQVEQGDEDKEVCVSNEEENEMQPSKSHLRLRVLVNGEEISESDDSVGDDWVGEKRLFSWRPFRTPATKFPFNSLRHLRHGSVLLLLKLFLSSK